MFYCYNIKKEGVPLAEKLIDISKYPVANVLDILLQDKSTKKNIIWATDTYEEWGEGFTDKVQMNARFLLRRADIILPRVEKSQEVQTRRTKKKAEVFTPTWLCNKMNNHCDEDWFCRSGVFNIENDDNTWTVAEGKIEFPKHKKWQNYVDSRRLEITCGEAPFLVSRYDASQGDLIVPPIRRIGMLDRKLRIVNENTDTYEDWLKWTFRAFKASYGYEFQGDNVLIARINLLLTFVDYYNDRYERQPEDNLLQQIANKIAWNIWQMDGLKNTTPLGKPYAEYYQPTLVDILEGISDNGATELKAKPCKIFDWRANNSIVFRELKEKRAMGSKLFDYVIGNPPYQEDTENTSDNPVYHFFMDAAYEVANKVELITPARFLFNAGKTPSKWNEKMLNDTHFKVLMYEQDSSKVFADTDIKGGVTITYRNENKNFGSIEVFSYFEELRTIKRKVITSETKVLSEFVYAPESYRFTRKLHKEHPEIKYVDENRGVLSKGHDFDLTTNIFDKLEGIIFFEDCPQDSETYIKILGRKANERTYMFVRRDYVEQHENLSKWKVFVPKSNGSGAIGEVLSTPLIGQPLIGHTQTFISIGAFDSEIEATNCLNYIKSKFARVMLGILKITQHNPPEKWKYVPLQDFTPNSDIDWTKLVHEIDLQLYKKYSLNEKEINFIETHVKGMA